MKILICASKHHYDTIAPIQATLEGIGHAVMLPNSFDAPMKEEEKKKEGPEAHREWKAMMLHKQSEKVLANDAVLVLNFDKGDKKNYIGGATFLEIFRAFDAGKKIFMWNPIPEGILTDELCAMGPVVINGDISKIR